MGLDCDEPKKNLYIMGNCGKMHQCGCGESKYLDVAVQFKTIYTHFNYA